MASGPFIITMNVDDIVQDIVGIPERAKTALAKWGAALAAQTHAHIKEDVSDGPNQLHSSRDKYLDALSFSQVGPETWVVSLERKARWIEDGMAKHEMIDDLLKSSKTKTAKDGTRYLAVPFNHGGRGFGPNDRGPTRTTEAQKVLQNQIRKELKQRGIPYGKLEVDGNGKPKTGLLHSFGGPNGQADITTPNRTSMTGPGQGHGPMGAPRQGPTGIPFLNNIRVYQREVTNKSGNKHVERHIMTFRMVSSKMKGTGRWVHPGMEGKLFFDKAYDWAMGQWDNVIKPKVLEEIMGPPGSAP